ncbi:MAG: flagellar hook-length control protein FliK, partial [Noviherbaspirillum sp.]
MFPRADMTGARPVAAIEAAKPTASIADARQDVLQRLTQIAVGRMMQAQVLSRMNDGSFMVKLADTAIRMNLPGSAQVGDTLELTLVTAHPRPTFSLGTPARESDTSLSSAARLIDSALRTAQK